MFTLTDPASELQRLIELRNRAASRLAGPAAAKGAPARAADALAVLHALASKPETASDALALLHELQVHQVELDLQSQELQESRAELESALRRQLDLYDGQPCGSFTIDARLVIHELNKSGAEMLGLERGDAFGLPLDGFFSTDDGRRFRAAISEIDSGMRRSACHVRLRPKTGAARAVLASVGMDRAADQYLVNLTMAETDPQPVSEAGS